MRLTLLAVVGGSLMGLGIFCAAGTISGPPEPQTTNDSGLYHELINAMRSGQTYYAASAAGLERHGYFRGSVFNWRLPTLSLIQSGLPSPAWWSGLLVLLGWGTTLAWLIHLRRCGWVVLLVVASGTLVMMPLWTHPGTSTLHDLWAGQLIAAALAAYAVGLRWSAVLLGAAALALRELALPFVLVMGSVAWVDGKRGELSAWLAVAAAFAGYMAWHWTQVSAQGTLGEASPDWVAFGGWCFVLKAARANVGLFALPTVLNAVIVPLAWIGLGRWSTPIGRRVFLTVSVYFALFVVAGYSVNWYWGFLVAPLLALGVVGWSSPQVVRSSS